MRIEYYPEAKLKKEVFDIVGKYLDTSKYKVFFFGSRVTGGGNERSDIDIGIEGPESVPNGIIPRIQEELENLPVLYKIDIVDFKTVSSSFYQVATLHREFI